MPRKNPMTPNEFSERMQELITGNEEAQHGAADDLMCKLLEELGYSEGVQIFLDMDKWYA